MADAPKSFRDPLYADLAASTEKQLGLPVGMLASVITHGERSNADQVSSAGARTVAQIIPATRDAALKKYGIDAYLSPANALEVAGRLLKDSLDRNKGDADLAVAEYIGGTDRSNWGKTTRAYVQRVSAGMQEARGAAMGGDFARWMAANPAVPARPAAAAPAQDKMGADFAAFLSGGAEIPGQTPETLALSGGPARPQTPAPEPTLGDQIIGAGEAALSTLTGATGGAVGMTGGLVGGIAKSILDGSFGTPEAADLTERYMAEGAQALTYAPRTAVGQERAEQIGQVMQQVLPAVAVAPAIVPPGATAPARAAVTDVARAAPPAAAQVARTAATATRNAVDAGLQRLPEAIRPAAREAQPTMGTLGSAGSAGADLAAQRVATAEALPVPIRLTRGEATREQGQQRFEAETAKDATNGAGLRERAVESNQRLAQNLEAMIDATGATATNAIETGRTVDSALRGAAARQKARYRVLYQQAEKAGELEAPVSTAPLVDFLAQNDSLNQGNLAGGSLGLLQRELVRLGGAEVATDGALVPREVPLKTMELLRRQMNNAIDAAPDNATNMRAGVQIKELIDQATEGLGGNLYREARTARMRYAQLFENNNVVSQLMRTKRGTTDRQVALEDVFRKTILNGSREDLHMLHRTLRATGGEEGRQAWKELKGATAKHLLDEATKGVGTDAAGRPLFSADKLNRAVQALERNGRLEYVMGKQGAQTIRDINEIAKAVRTTPPGVVNTSNTASVVLTALAEAGVTGSMTGLPVPVLSVLKAGAKFSKDRKVQRRVDEALRYAEQRNTPQRAP